MTLLELISGRGFDRYRTGLESRFRANRLTYSIEYSESGPNLFLFVRLEGKERRGEICAWENGRCELGGAGHTEKVMKKLRVSLDSEDAFHDNLAQVFRYVVKRGRPTDELGK